MVKTAMSPRNVILAVEPEEKITKIACVLAGTDCPSKLILVDNMFPSAIQQQQ